MEIIVRAVGNKQYHDFLMNKVKPRVRFILTCLSKTYHFTLPPYLYLIPLRRKSMKGCENCEVVCRMKKLCAYGRAGKGLQYPLYISVNIAACKRDNYLWPTIAHEAAHIAEYCIDGVFTHSKLLHSIDETAQKLVKLKECYE